ncbi:polysaccharide lyase 8 family protein [uncultured Streptomyces sp.]|uniref:polysaccharide lyase 8 family protein n=1 Tax=uncultured Streptomyces sp. TaxID=174707 RepID=UPI0026131FCC|nr:polysaccharide lyase 8 family protein [uncultured Streptomyces sp.]
MSAPWPRRTFLRTAGAASLALGASVGTWPGTAAADEDPYAALRQKWRELILGTGFVATEEPYATLLTTLGANARTYLSTMRPAEGSLWADLVWSDPDPDLDAESYAFSERMNGSYTRLQTMAQAYAQPGTGLTGDAGLLQAVVTGLDHMYATVYNERVTRYGNWWNWQIGAPQALMDTAVLLYDALSEEQIADYCAAVDHFVPDSLFASYTGVSTGANRVDLCRGVILRGIVGRSAEKIALAAGALPAVFPYVTSGDGFYADGSFIQHTNVPYIGAYGAVLHDGVGRLLALLRGSTWEIDAADTQPFLDTVEKAVAPFIYNGLIMDNVGGRSISRVGGNDHTRAHSLIATVLLVGQGASPAENARWRAMVKGWLERDYYRPATANNALSLTRMSLLQDVLRDASVVASPEPVEHRNFADMSRVTHRRPGWAASISMSSRRIAHYEYGNGENARGYHTGSGWLSWWGAEVNLEQYSDAYWPTVDPYRLPGITASKKPLADGQGGEWGQPPSDTVWVGGATDGEFGAVGHHLKAIAGTMTARKSWFCLDDAIVCLGSGITATDGHLVETTVDNRALGTAGAPRFVVDGRTQPSAQGWAQTFPRAEWAHIEGHAGYVFPGGTTLDALREERTGAWRDINVNGPTTPNTRRYLTLWNDHGTDPVDAGYAYVLMPGASAKATARRAQHRNWLTVTAATPAQHGVRVASLGFAAVNFWQPGTVDGITVDAPASVLVREHRDGTATLVVADPTRLNTSLQLLWARRVKEIVSAPDGVTATTDDRGRRLRLAFGDFTKLAGAGLTVRVRLH